MPLRYIFRFLGWACALGLAFGAWVPAPRSAMSAPPALGFVLVGLAAVLALPRLRGWVWLWCSACLMLGWALSLCGWVRGAAVVLAGLPPAVPALMRLRDLPAARVGLLSWRLRVWRWLVRRVFVPGF